MHYYQFNIGNYRRKTNHLSLLEHGIYRLLIDTYYLSEGPLCDDDAELMRTSCVRTEEERAAFKNVMKDFFIKEADGYHHKDCDDLIAKFLEKSEKARKSADARWAKDANAMRTHSEGNADAMLPNNPIPNTQRPTNQSIKSIVEPAARPVTKNEFVHEVFKHWQEVLNHPAAKLDKKRAGKINDALKLGYSPDELKSAIRGCSVTPYNMGQNDRGQKYDSIDLIFRDADHIDRFIRNDNAPPKPLTQSDMRSQANVLAAKEFLEGF